jgi:hypothetical protein
MVFMVLARSVISPAPEISIFATIALLQIPGGAAEEPADGKTPGMPQETAARISDDDAVSYYGMSQIVQGVLNFNQGIAVRTTA